MWSTNYYLSIEEVNNLESDQFIKIFGNIVEHCLAAGIGILKHRPFSKIEDVVEAVECYLNKLKPQELINVLQLYPDSVSKFASFTNSMLEFNTHQKIIDKKSVFGYEDKKRLTKLVENYKEKHKFPFIICLKKEEDIEILATEIESRLMNDTENEIAIALKEVNKICRFRIYEIIK